MTSKAARRRAKRARKNDTGLPELAEIPSREKNGRKSRAWSSAAPMCQP